MLHNGANVGGDLLRRVWRGEQGMQLTVRIDQQDGRAVDDRVAVTLWLVFPRDAHGIRDRRECIAVTAQANEVGIEIFCVLGRFPGVIALHVHRDEHDLWRGIAQPVSDLVEHEQGVGADIRAIGEAEEHQAPVVFEILAGEDGLGSAFQRELRQEARTRQHGGRLRLQGLGRLLANDGEGKAGSGGDCRNHHQQDRISLLHPIIIPQRLSGSDSSVMMHAVIIRKFMPSECLLARAEIESLQETATSLSTGRDFIYWAAACFESSDLFYGHGTDNPLDEAVALVMHVLALPYGCPDELLDERMSMAEKTRVHDLVKRRIEQREPLAYLLGEAWFAGLRFKADARALVPRSPIAELVEEGYEPWVDADSVTAVLDLCTGGGSIAIATALALPQAKVDAVDLSAEALALAAENVALHEVGERVTLYRGDLFAPLPGKRYDIIVSNPPYVDAEDMAALPEEFRREPELGLAAGDDGLDIVHRILAEAPRYLVDDGVLIVEVGNSAPALEAAYPGVEFTWLEFERGGDGIFLLTAAQLRAIAENK